MCPEADLLKEVPLFQFLDDQERAALAGDQSTVLAMLQQVPREDSGGATISPVLPLVSSDVAASPETPPCPKCGSPWTRRSKRRERGDLLAPEFSPELLSGGLYGFVKILY